MNNFYEKALASSENNFGEVLRESGPMAKANPLRFSTKYQDEETGLLYYGLRNYSPDTGRWTSGDPLEEYAGLNIYEFALNEPVGTVDLFGLGTWTVTTQDVRDYFTEQDILTGSPKGFKVTYDLSAGECPKNEGNLVLYQTITSPVGKAHVDRTKPPHKAPKTGCPLPPPMRPAPSGNSYVDSPLHGSALEKSGEGILGGIFKITAVAVCRKDCKQKRLSTYYFEWDNKTRTITASNTTYLGQYVDAMHEWYE